MDQNVALWIGIGIAIVVILLLIALVVFGKRRGEQKKVSFEKPSVEDQPKKELTQQEKSGNYQAKSGFNFAPAGGGKPAEKQPAEATQPTQAKKTVKPASAAAPGERDATDVANAQLRGDDPDQVKPRPTEDTGEKRAEAAHDGPAADSSVKKAAEDAVAKAKAKTETDVPAETSAAAERPAEDTRAGKDPQAEEKTESAEKDNAVQKAEAVEADEAPVAEVSAPKKSEEELSADTTEEGTQQAALAAGAQADAASEARKVTKTPGAEESEETAAPQAAEENETAVTDEDETTVREPAEEAVQPQEDIAPAAGRLGRLRGRLSRSQNAIGQGLMGILSAGDLDDDAWEEIEDTLIMADLGTKSTMKVTDSLQQKIAERGVSSEAEAREMLRESLIEAGHPEMDRSIRAVPSEGKPAIVLVVGVNGTGKTTTTGKLGRVLTSMGHKVLFGAADTFRAAAADQLETWGRRVGATTVRGKEGADPASVAFDAVARGIEEQADVVLVDTAGRLHTSTDLMDQLGKVKRVVEKKTDVDEVLLVIDATVGQNGLMQARVFREVVDISGVVLTKLDGTAKGGIVFQVQEELGVPVKLVGLGEGADDLAPFEVESFVDALLG